MQHLIYNGDCQDILKALEAEGIIVPLIFADPPDNLGLAYEGYIDDIDEWDYKRFLNALVMRMYHQSEVCWLSYYWAYDLYIGSLLEAAIKPDQWRKILWRFTFGQHNHHDLGSGYRTLLRLAKAEFDFAECMDAIRTPSVRQQMGDSRADPRGRVPDDVWEFPRVVGNAAERRQWHPTQHPEALLERLLKSSNRPSKPLNLVIDLFGGTGSMLRVCERLEIPCLITEQSTTYCRLMSYSTQSVCTVTDSVEKSVAFIVDKLYP